MLLLFPPEVNWLAENNHLRISDIPIDEKQLILPQLFAEGKSPSRNQQYYMNLIKKGVLLAAMYLAGLGAVHADSPVTSTEVARAYAGEAIVKKALADGFSDEIMRYLYDEKNPLDIKMAVINTAGWAVEGKQNAAIYGAFLMKKGKYRDTDDLLARGKGHELLAMGYLTAMDDYFDVTPAIPYVDKALERMPESYTCNIIRAIVVAQSFFEADWCAVYSVTNEVRMNESLTMDMRQESVDAIFEYMDLYAEYCDMDEGYEEGEFYTLLTQISFGNIYAQDDQIISKAMNAESGELTSEMIGYLLNDSKPLQHKIALINVVGVRPDALANSQSYWNALKQLRGYSHEDDFRARGTADELLCLAYLAALDNPGNVGEAMVYAELASQKKKDSYTVLMIRALIRAQNYYLSDWCKVYSEYDRVNRAKTIRKDMKSEVMQVISESMEAYSEYCGE